MTWPERGKQMTLCLAGLLLASGSVADGPTKSGNPFVDESASGFTVGGDTGQGLAQIVVAEVAGQAVELQFPGSCDSGILTAELRAVRDGRPGTQVLARAAFSPDPPTTRYRDRLIVRLEDGAALAPGQEFAIVLSSTGVCEISSAPAGDTYPDGSAFYRDRATAGSWWPLGDSDDLPFRVHQQVSPGRVVVVIDLNEDQGGDETRKDEDGEEHERGSFVRVSCFVQALGLSQHW